MKRVRAVVTGRVQGVGFRWSARAEAKRVGVVGFIRNLPDGSVEAEIEGDAVDEMLVWLGHGPAGAEVDAVEVTALHVIGSDGFEIR